MDLDSFIITVFCHVDDALRESFEKLRAVGIRRLRQRGPSTRLSDSEVLTMEVVGQYLGISQDKAIFDYFRRHYSHFFPSISLVHRTTFVRQGANLWKVKQLMWRYFINLTHHDEGLAFIDSFPMPVCRFARAPQCRRFRDISSFGRDGSTRQIFYGMRVHARVCWPGVITGVELAPANVHELELVTDLAQGTEGKLLGDRNYWAPLLGEELGQEGVDLLAPYRKATSDPNPIRSGVLSRTRQKIEVVFGQLCERFSIKRLWAKDLWHLCSRMLRALLTHTVCLYLNQLHGNRIQPLRFAELVP